MKKLFILSMLFACLSVSCNKVQETITPSVEVKTAPILISNLRALNDSLIGTRPRTKLDDVQKGLIATVDAAGAYYGYSQGKSIGFWIGLATGHPALGKVIGGAVGGLFIGAACSYIAYKGVSHAPNTAIYNHTLNAIIDANLIDTIDFGSGDSSNGSGDNLHIDFPEDGSEGNNVGSGHNTALGEMLEGEPGDGIHELPDYTGNRAIAMQVLTSDDFKSSLNQTINDYFYVNGEFALPSSVSGDDPVSEVVNLYFELNNEYVNSLEDSIMITNYYISQIENSTELTDEDKTGLYYTFSVASYSTSFWNDYLEQ